jgi:hypothetical protein
VRNGTGSDVRPSRTRRRDAGIVGGEGLNASRDGGAPVTSDYPGEAPWAFTGGTLHHVAVDVSGDPYIDLEREAVAMFARE